MAGPKAVFYPKRDRGRSLNSGPALQALVQNPIDDAHAGVDTARNGLSKKLLRVQVPSPISYATPTISGTRSAMDSTTRVGENGNSRNDSRVLDPVSTRML